MSSRAEEKAAAREARLEAEQQDAARTTRLRRLRILGGVALVAILAVVVAVALSGGSSDDSTKKAQTKAGGTSIPALFAGIPQSGFTLGKPSAEVTVEEFIDPQCPFCAQFSREALPTVVKDYVRTGKIKLVMRPLAFIGPDSLTAARVVAGAAQQDKAWTFLDTFYANQKPENSGYVTDAFLRKVGGAVPGLDVNKALQAGQTDPTVTKQLKAANTRAKQVGANSTPTLLLTLNGQSQQIPLDANDYTGSVTKSLDAVLSQ
jgi:protein-disulfide isomerase